MAYFLVYDPSDIRDKASVFVNVATGAISVTPKSTGTIKLRVMARPMKNAAEERFLNEDVCDAVNQTLQREFGVYKDTVASCDRQLAEGDDSYAKKSFADTYHLVDEVFVYELTLAIKPKRVFGVTGFRHYRPSQAGRKNYMMDIKNGTTIEHEHNTVLHLAPINVTEFKPGGGGSTSREDITFTMDGAPEGFFIDPQTGEVQGAGAVYNASEPEAARVQAITLNAVDDKGATSRLYTFQVKVVKEAVLAILNYTRHDRLDGRPVS